MTLDQAIAHLREIAESVPNPSLPPTEDEILQVEKELGVKFHPDYRKYLLEAGDVVFGALEPATVNDPESHTHLPNIAEDAWESGVPKKQLPICEDNGDYYCMDVKSGKITFWDHNGVSDDTWPNLATWIEEVWIGENLEDDGEEGELDDDDED